MFVFDEKLERVPFASLTQANGRYLIEDYSVSIAPSVSSFLRSSHGTPKRSRALLSVGNPFSASEESSPLDGAEAEATEIAAMYPSRALLLRATATRQRVVSALAYCDAAHFAVHASAGDRGGGADEEGVIGYRPVTPHPHRQRPTIPPIRSEPIKSAFVFGPR